MRRLGRVEEEGVVLGSGRKTQVGMSAPINTIRTRHGSDGGKLTLGIFLAVVGMFAMSRASWGSATTSCMILAILGLVASSFVLLERSADPLHPVAVAVLLYAVSMAVAPLWLGSFYGSERPAYGAANDEALTWAAVLALVGMLALLAGYSLVRLGSGRSNRSGLAHWDLSGKTRTFMLGAAVVLGALGVVCYLTLVMKGGGTSYFLQYNLGRADIFRGIYGGWFWGAMLMFAALGLFGVCMIHNHPWWCLTIALMMSGAFFLFQGRDLVIAPLFCWLTLFHYGRRRFRWQAILAGGVLLIVVSAFVGTYRMTANTKVRADWGQMTEYFYENLDLQIVRVVAQNIEQLDSVAIAVRYVRHGGELLGPLALLNWIEPIDRQLFGDSIPTIETGRFMDLLVYPEHVGWNTALSPSLIGELYIALGLGGVLIGMFVYGAVLAMMQRWVDNRFHAPVLFAAYPFVSYMIFKMVVDGTGQLFRLVLILAVVWACVWMAPIRRTRSFDV
ncbi:MAG: oligosaccharide repeat unit polymerase [Gammaproteobacteria bacterium]|nr:MAG: oligosaccharide repeat unit polymerase [Gammaproteobacteria bacterium]